MSDALEQSTWLELQELFRRALELPAPLRGPLFALADAHGPTCRQALQRLLDAHEAQRCVLDQSPHLEAETAFAAPPDALINQRIGNYVISELIGVGGLGVVYRAWQQHPRRAIALKLPRFAFESPELLRRFEFEAEVLGRLQHPNIAQIIEAGTFQRPEAAAQPFIAMELIDGLPLDAFVRLHRLSLKERIQLLIRVCEGVHHAHQRGVIHHDLKPSNILVVCEDNATAHRGAQARSEPAQAGEPPARTRARRAAAVAAPQPKILDFGIARWVDAQQRTHPAAPRAGVLGTLAYMSPEQLAGEGDSTGTRCDIYALGVIAFELLANRLPRDIPRGASLLEALRLSRTQAPLRLAQAAPRLSPDLDAIVGKAMDADPGQRYSATPELAEDLTRFLQQLPVRARLPNAAYQSRMFARRHRALVSGAALALAALMLGLLGFAWQAQSEARQRAAADARLRAAIKSNSQLVEWVENGLANLPGSTALRLDFAQAGLRELQALRMGTPATHPGSDELDYYLGYAHQRLGEVRLTLGEPQAALTSFRAALAIRQQQAERCNRLPCRRALGVGHWKLGDALTELRRFDEAIGCYHLSRDIHESLRNSPGTPVTDDPVYLGLAHQRLGIAERRAGRPADALREFEQALAWFARGLSYEPANVQLLRGLTRVSRERGAALHALGRADESLAACAQALESVEKLVAISGPSSVWERTQRAHVLGVRAELYAGMGMTAEADRDLVAALNIARELASADPQNAESAALLRHVQRAMQAATPLPDSALEVPAAP